MDLAYISHLILRDLSKKVETVECGKRWKGEGEEIRVVVIDVLS